MIVSSMMFFFFKQKTAYEMRISDWSSDVCSSDLQPPLEAAAMIDAASAAFEATGENRWVEEAAHVYAWYLGENDLRLPICTRDDRCCYDGLMPDRVNLNQCAESVIPFQLACCAMQRLKAGFRAVPAERLAAE